MSNVVQYPLPERKRQLSRSATFRAELTSPHLSFVMEAHNGLSAKIVEEAGFPAIWASGLSMSAALGVRDSNEASWTQVLEILEFMADATSIPILVDGDTGYGNFNNVRRLVRKLCQRNVAAVCIEDKLFPKTNSYVGGSQPLAEIDEFCGKIKAGKDSQTDSDFCLIARVEALIAGWGLDEALCRAEAYHAAGADGILIHSKLSVADEVLAFQKEWSGRCPVIIVPTTYYQAPSDVFREAKISMVIWANHNLRATINAMRTTSQRIFERQNLTTVEPRIASMADVFQLAGNNELAEAEARYLAGRTADRSAIVIAASRGSKLGELTRDRPKCMIDIRGQPLLRRLVATMNQAGIRNVTVVRGYMKEAVNLPWIETVDNDDYADTGEVASLACASQRLSGNTVLSYGDVLFRPFILDALLDAGAEGASDIVLAVDALGRRRDYRSAGRLVDLVSAKSSRPGSVVEPHSTVEVVAVGHALPPERVDGEWMGLAWLSKRGAGLVRDEIAAMKADKSLSTACLLDLFMRIIEKGHKVSAIYMTGNWLDVDDAFDLADARNLY